MRLTLSLCTFVACPLLGLSPLASAQSFSATPIVITEYVEGTGDGLAGVQYDAIELQNVSGQVVVIPTIALYQNYVNGGSSVSNQASMSDLALRTFQPFEVKVLCSNQAPAALLARCTTTWFGLQGMTGNDVFVLKAGAVSGQLNTTGYYLDGVGQIGHNPASGSWGSGDIVTANKTLRKAVCSADTNPFDAYDPIPLYTSHPVDTIDGLGTGLTATCPPVLLSPVTGSTPGSTPTLSWAAALNATSYDLQIASDDAFNDVVLSETGLTSLSYTPSIESDEGTYYWRVRGVGAEGPSAYTAGRSFTGTLPVELVAFTATADGAAARLTWTTASETGNAGFAVEAQRDAAWQEIAFVTGRGTTSEAHTYTRTVSGLAPGRHAFRLRQIDMDGTATVSSTVEVEIAGNGRLSVYPSPARTSVRMDGLTAPADVVDALGRVVARAVPGEALSVGTWAPGVYVVMAAEPQRFVVAH